MSKIFCLSFYIETRYWHFHKKTY